MLISSFIFFSIFIVLKAINEDSPTVPTLLTDYILKGEYENREIKYTFFNDSDINTIAFIDGIHKNGRGYRFVL